MWKTDGTVAGTQLVKDFVTGGVFGSPILITNLNGVLFISTTSSLANGYELWKSDGTTSGTVFLKDINPGTANSYVSSFTSYDGKIIFSADNGANGKEIWKTDTTAVGTKLLYDINPGSGDSNPNFYTPFNNTLLFIATDVNGTELWELPPCKGLDVTLTGSNATSGSNGSITSAVIGGTSPFSYA